jgi:hypothetical protein
MKGVKGNAVSILIVVIVNEGGPRAAKVILPCLSISRCNL